MKQEEMREAMVEGGMRAILLCLRALEKDPENALASIILRMVRDCDYREYDARYITAEGVKLEVGFDVPVTPREEAWLRSNLEPRRIIYFYNGRLPWYTKERALEWLGDRLWECR